MNRKRISCIGLFMLLCGLLVAQNIPQVNRERLFVGTALYGFMNGGSDLYYEYGFKQLIAREVLYKGEDYTVDIYQMASPEDAFGIYSIHTYKCQRAEALGGINCQSQYQLQAAIGNEYISVVFLSGSENARQTADELLEFYAKKAEKDTLKIPDQLSFLKKPYSSILKLLKGPLAIANIYPEFAKLVEGMADYSIWLVEKENRTLLMLKNNTDCRLLKSRLPVAQILQSGDNFLLISLE